MAVVYLLHFDRKLHHAQHYIGSADDLDSRIRLHENGRGSRLLSVISQKGIAFQIARVWENTDRKFESHLKKHYKNARMLCPVCSGSEALHRMEGGEKK